MDDQPVGDPWDDAVRRPGGLVAGPGRPSLSARLDGWLADARTDASAAARAREHWLHAAAAAEATLAGVLLDLAERHTAVAVTTATGRRHHGSIEVLGADFVALRLAGGGEVLVALSAVATVRTAPLVEPADGDRAVATGLALVEVLAELAAERAPVLVVAAGSEAVAGELRAVGTDVVTVRGTGDPPMTAYISLRAIAEVALG